MKSNFARNVIERETRCGNSRYVLRRSREIIFASTILSEVEEVKAQYDEWDEWPGNGPVIYSDDFGFYQRRS